MEKQEEYKPDPTRPRQFFGSYRFDPEKNTVEDLSTGEKRSITEEKKKDGE